MDDGGAAKGGGGGESGADGGESGGGSGGESSGNQAETDAKRPRPDRWDEMSRNLEGAVLVMVRSNSACPA